MAVSLIAVDVDGTLLNSRGEITAATRAAFQEAADRGIALALSTGRARDECGYILQALPGIRYIINCSGASVYDARAEQELYAGGIPMDTIRDLYRRVADLDCLFEPMADGHVYVDQDRFSKLSEYQNHYYIAIIRATRTPVDLEALLRTRTAPVAKLHLFFRSATDQQKARARLEPAGLPVLCSIPENLELNHPAEDKGTGLRQLAAALGVPLADCMAIGDNVNDIPMFEAAGYPVGMGNILPEADPHTRYRTASCDGDGVANVIRSVLAGTLEDLRKEP